MSTAVVDLAAFWIDGPQLAGVIGSCLAEDGRLLTVLDAKHLSDDHQGDHRHRSSQRLGTPCILLSHGASPRDWILLSNHSSRDSVYSGEILGALSPAWGRADRMA